MGIADVIVRREIDQRLGFGQLAQAVVVLALLEFGLKGFWQFHDYKYKERRVVFSPDVPEESGGIFLWFSKNPSTALRETNNKRYSLVLRRDRNNFLTTDRAPHKKTQPFARLGF